MDTPSNKEQIARYLRSQTNTVLRCAATDIGFFTAIARAALDADRVHVAVEKMSVLQDRLSGHQMELRRLTRVYGSS